MTTLGRIGLAITLIVGALAALPSCAGTGPGPGQRTFAAPEEAVRTLIEVVKAGDLDGLIAIFGPEGRELIASSDAASGRQNREVFTVAAAEAWRLVDEKADTKVLVIGREGWPFPVPLVKDARGWRFDIVAGREEVLARRIGRNELAVIQVCRTYVSAQRLYARRPHDGKPAGLHAAKFRSDPGRQNGLYWPAQQDERRSPLGDLVAQAAAEGRQFDRDGAPAPFHGYYFKILTAQGANVAGGARNYMVNGELSDGFALIAWPAQYNVTGVMTFVVNHDGAVYEKDLGPETDAAARAIALYNPDGSWGIVN